MGLGHDALPVSELRTDDANAATLDLRVGISPADVAVLRKVVARLRAPAV